MTADKPNRPSRRRRILRVLVVILVILVAVPFVVPLPPVGVDAASLADPGGEFITVDGLSTYVLARGPADGPPVVLLHGWGASTFTWREQLDVLAEAGYRAIAFDRPPYGLSQKTGAGIPYTPGALADFTAHVMDALGVERAVLVGQSQGGGVAGYFAVRYPARVEKLVLVSAALRPTDDPAPEGDGGGRFGLPPFVATLLQFRPIAWWAQVAIRLFATPDFSTAILRSAYHDPAFMTPAIADGYNRQLKVIGWDAALLNQFRGTGGSPEPLPAAEIAAIDAPVMIAWGADDSWVPLAVGERLRALLPEAAWQVYPAVGHLPQEEAAAAFNADLLAFLNSD